MPTIPVEVMHFENDREISVVLEIPKVQRREIQMTVLKPQIETKTITVRVPDMSKPSRTEIVYVQAS